MFTFLLSEGKYHLLLLPPRFGSESTNYHNWQMSSWENNGNCSCACSLPRHDFLKLKPEKLPCQNQQLCHQASRSQGSVVNAHKIPYLENFSYLKAFIIQPCKSVLPTETNTVAMKWWHGDITLFAWPSAKNHSFFAGTVAFGITPAVPCSLWYFWALFSPSPKVLLTKVIISVLECQDLLSPRRLLEC